MSKGFDHYHPNQELALCLLLEEATGTATGGWEKAAHLFTLHGVPTWVSLANGLAMLNFVPGNPDYIDCPALDTVDLDFTASDFSGLAWVYTAASGSREIFNKGSVATANGWGFYVSPTIVFFTVQAGPTSQATSGGPIALNTWHCVGFSRAGAVARIYNNGADATTISGTHVNPATAAANAFTIGSSAGGGAGWWSGRIWGLRIWSKLIPAAVFKTIFENERHLFGV